MPSACMSVYSVYSTMVHLSFELEYQHVWKWSPFMVGFHTIVALFSYCFRLQMSNVTRYNLEVPLNIKCSNWKSREMFTW